MALIELAHVSRHYSHGEVEVRALDDVSLRIEAGEMVAIIGASGSGKSTLMNVLGCLDNPTQGQFRIDGQDVAQFDTDELAALRRERFGFIFQRYHLLSHLDAIGNVEMPAIYAGVAPASRRGRASALLARLGLSDRLGHRPNALSGGQQQRVSIARALMNGGEIILADEPTGALDSRSGAEMLALLKELNARGHTIIIVTHDANVAAHARRVIELRDGHVVRDSGSAEATASAAAVPARADRDDAPALRPAGRLRRWAIQWREALAMAFAALRGNRLRSALSMLGISIGIAAVVSIVALTQSAKGALEGQIRDMVSGRIWVWSGGPNMPPGQVAKPFRESELASLRGLPGVVDVAVQRQSTVTARHGPRSGAVELRGTPTRGLKFEGLVVKEGRDLSDLDQDLRAQVMVLDRKAQETLFKPGEAAIGQQVMVDALPFTVIGLADVGGGPIPFTPWTGRMFIPQTTYANKVDVTSEVRTFSVQSNLSVPPSQLRDQIVHRLKALHGQEDFGVNNPEEEFKKLDQVTSIMALVLTAVGGISLLVGGVGVMNIMLVSVSERTREIGIRMAVGARQADVRLQFLIEAVVLCCLGGLVGVTLSWLGAQGINAVQQQLKVNVSWMALAVAFGVSSAIGVLFGTMPARRAAALSPVDALARE
jgi:macrolide transport system ATP-binding/permease protein